MTTKQTLFNTYCKTARRLNLNLLPPLIIWEPTLRCNYRCSFCGFYGPGGALPDLKKELSIEQQKDMWNKILDDYKTYKPHIGITGGEPLTQQISPILALFKSRKIPFSITTNGFLLNDHNVKILSDNGCGEIRISIHGPEEVHDSTVNIIGAYKKVIENIKNAKKYNIPILINCVITDNNVNWLEFMKKLSCELDVKIRFQHLEWTTTELQEVHAKVTKELFGQVLPVKYGTTKLNETSIMMLKMFQKEHQNTEYEPREIKDLNAYYNTQKPLCKYCHQPWGTARIDPYGNVYPCIDYYYGNLTMQTFENIWKGEKANNFRKLLKQNKMFPACTKCCKLN